VDQQSSIAVMLEDLQPFAGHVSGIVRSGRKNYLTMFLDVLDLYGFLPPAPHNLAIEILDGLPTTNFEPVGRQNNRILSEKARHGLSVTFFDRISIRCDKAFEFVM
jgi:hypothetical protein